MQENNIIVINAGGFVDFLSGFEQRAPKRVRKIRVGETFWRIACNPRKNFKKMRWMFGVFRLFFTYRK
jgi:UDP-N-acetyl-D-mannosaminuronic acid transferase (WecB/TagA/CpsF family)